MWKFKPSTLVVSNPTTGQKECGDLSELGMAVIGEPFNAKDPWLPDVDKVLSRLVKGQVPIATNKLGKVCVYNEIINKYVRMVVKT